MCTTLLNFVFAVFVVTRVFLLQRTHKLYSFCSIVAPCRLISLLFFTIYLVNLSLKHLSMFTKRVTNGMCEWYIVQSSNQRNHFSYTCTNTFEDAGLFLKRCKILGYYYTICSISDLCTKSCHYSLRYLLCQKTYELSYASVYKTDIEQ